jgi:hypothetical protein
LITPFQKAHAALRPTPYFQNYPTALLPPGTDLEAILVLPNGFSSLLGSDLTSSTIPGIGSLSGKAIKALGNSALWGLQRFIISTHINAILTKFPHSNAQARDIEGIQEIYGIVLELSRYFATHL